MKRTPIRCSQALNDSDGKSALPLTITKSLWVGETEVTREAYELQEVPHDSFSLRCVGELP